MDGTSGLGDAGKSDTDSVTDWIWRTAAKEVVRGELGNDELKRPQFLREESLRVDFAVVRFCPC